MLLDLPEGEFKQPQTRESQYTRVMPGRSGQKRERTASENTGAGSGGGRQKIYIEHTERMRRQAAAFEKSRPANVEQFQIWAPRKIEFAQHITDCIQALYQEQVINVTALELAEHKCSLSSDVECLADILKTEKYRYVVVIDTGRNFVLKVPTYCCKRCRHADGSPVVVTAPPCALNCGPTAPTENCSTWITDEALHLFGDLHARNGLSLGAFIHAMMNTKKFLTPEGGEMVNYENKQFNATIKKEQLITAIQEHWKVEDAATKIETLSTDPFQHCFICAETGRKNLSNGTPVPPYKVQISTDAINSANKFLSAGRSQRGVEPSTDTYLGNVAKEVLQLHDAGTLTSKAKDRAAAQEKATALAEEGTLPACTTALTCNRESATSKRAEMEYTGQVAVVCSHIIPGLGLTVAMTTPEQHIFYDMVLIDALQRMSYLGVIFLDLMCRYHVRFTRLVAEMLLRDLVLADAAEIQLLLPWMHAFDHDMDCQLKFSGLYREGVGRRVGEQTESWWAQIKPFSKIARYMTHAHYWDGYNMLYHLLSRSKQLNLPTLLESKISNTEKKIVSYKKDVAALTLEARSHEVNDLDAAMALLQGGEVESRPKLSKVARYVQAVMALRLHEGFENHKASLPLHVPGNTGIHLHAKAGDEGVKKKMVEVADNLLAEMPSIPDLSFGEHWTQDLPQYQAGLAELRARVLEDIQIKVEQQVFKKVVIEYELNQCESSKNRSKAAKRLQRVIANIKEQLEFYRTWKAMGTSQPPEAITQEMLRKIYAGDYPWKTKEGERNGSLSAQRHYGCQYRTAINQLRRTEEERMILKVEVIRLFNRLEEVRGALLEQINDEVVIYSMLDEELRSLHGNAVESNTSRRAEIVKLSKLARGRECLLNVELRRVNLILKDADKLLRKHLPPAPVS